MGTSLNDGMDLMGSLFVEKVPLAFSETVSLTARIPSRIFVTFIIPTGVDIIRERR